MGPRRILAIDIGAGHVAAGIFRAKGRRLRLEQIAAESHLPDETTDDQWSRRVAQSLARLTIARDGVDGCVMVLPGHVVLTKHIRTPSVPAARRDRSIHFEASENIPLPLDQVTWNHRMVADDGVDMDVLLCASKSETIQGLHDAATSAGFRCVDVQAGCLALRKSHRYNFPNLAEPVLVVGVGAQSTQLLLMSAGQFRVRTVRLGGSAVTEAVVKELKIEFAAAETLKLEVCGGTSHLGPDSPSRGAVERAAEDFGGKLVLEVRLTLAGWNHQRCLAAAASICLTGGGSLIPHLPGKLEEELRVRVKRYEPLGEVSLTEQARGALVPAAVASLPELVGAAALQGAHDETGSSLLPGTIRRTIEARKRRASWIAACALAVLTPVPPILSYHRQTAATRARSEAIERQLAPLRALRSSNELQYRKLGSLNKRIAALGPAYGARGSWIALLADFQSKLSGVENVWLDRLRVEVPARGSEGSGRASFDLESGSPRHIGEPARLLLAGRLLDVENPQAKVSPQSYDRVKRLLELLRESPCVAAVGAERFDNSLNGILRFEVTLVLNPAGCL